MSFTGNLSKWQVDRSWNVGTTATYVTFDWQNLRLKSIQVHNSGAAYTSAVVLISNDNSHFGTLTAIAGGTLATNTTWQYTDDTAYKYYKIGAAVAAGTITVSVKFS
jgi:hypothetical protein